MQVYVSSFVIRYPGAICYLLLGSAGIRFIFRNHISWSDLLIIIKVVQMYVSSFVIRCLGATCYLLLGSAGVRFIFRNQISCSDLFIII